MMNNEKEKDAIDTSKLDEILPKYDPLKLNSINLAQNYVSAFNTGMNIYQCVNQLQGYIEWVVKAVNDVVKSWNVQVGESIDQSKAIVRETTTEQFNTEWTNKQPELINQVNTLTTNQFNEDWGVLENRINTTLETQNTKINSIQTQQTNLSNQQTTLSNRMDTFTSLSEGSTTGDAELKDIRVGANGVTYNNAGDAVRGQYSQLKEDLVKLKDYLAVTTNYEEGYYVSTTGELIADDGYCVTEKINIESILGANFWYGTNDTYKIRLCSFNADDEFIDYWGGLNNKEFRNIPNFGTNASYVRFSFQKGYDAKLTSGVYNDGSYTTYWQAEENVGIDKRQELLTLSSSVIGKEGLSKRAPNLSSGSALLIDSNISIKKNKVYHLHTLIDSNFDALYFGHGESEYSLYFKIDNTNITFMTNGIEGSQLPHGLTFDTYIDFMLIVGEKNTGTIILNTLGGVYTKTIQTVNGYKGNIFVRPFGCSLTDVFIGFSCSDFRQPIWMFGDSYFTHTSDVRWTYWLIEWGFSRCLINAFAGENSSEALPQVLSYLENNGKPKYIVWCLGMNDPDNNGVNSSWLSCVKTLIYNCKKHGVTPILATIPNVPSYDNRYKNAWVKTSGYRYIDFAKAVGAESAGSTWYNGCLSNDNTHPTEKGARLLCLQALQDVSELTLGNV